MLNSKSLQARTSDGENSLGEEEAGRGDGEHVEEGRCLALAPGAAPSPAVLFSPHRQQSEVVFLGHALWTTYLNQSFSQELVEMQRPCPHS